MRLSWIKRNTEGNIGFSGGNVVGHDAPNICFSCPGALVLGVICLCAQPCPTVCLEVFLVHKETERGGEQTVVYPLTLQ